MLRIGRRMAGGLGKGPCVNNKPAPYAAGNREETGPP